MKITCIRHMETPMNKLGVFQGSTDAVLGEQGQKDSEQFAQLYDMTDVDCIYSSCLQRTVYLANQLVHINPINHIKDARLNEINLGKWEGRTWAEIQQTDAQFLQTWFKDNGRINVPGGESYEDVQHRAFSVLEEIAKSDYKHVVIVTHGGVIKSLVCKVLGLPLKQRSSFTIDNGSITEFQVHNNRYKVTMMNHRLF